MLIALVAAFGLWPGWIILLAPLFLLATLCLSFAIGLGLTTLDAFFRDVRLTLPFVMQFCVLLFAHHLRVVGDSAKVDLALQAQSVCRAAQCIPVVDNRGAPPPHRNRASLELRFRRCSPCRWTDVVFAL